MFKPSTQHASTGFNTVDCIFKKDKTTLNVLFCSIKLLSTVLKNITVNTVKSTLKPWAYITSKGVLGGLINGGGLYPGGLISRIKKMFRSDQIKCI